MSPYADPQTGRTAPEVTDALGRFFDLPEEEQKDRLANIRETVRSKRRAHLKTLGVRA